MKIFTLGARVLLAILVVFFVVATAGCGGGGSKDPVIVPQAPVTYRILLFDHIYGGKVVNEITIQKEAPIEDRQFMLRLECTNPDGYWIPVTQELPFTITVMGAPSGTWLPDIGFSGGQFRLKAGEYLLEFQPPIDGHLGTATLEVHVPDVGASVVFTVTIIAGTTPPSPPAQTCRDIHPVREAIGGYWWDCVGGVWSNTGELVDQPLTCQELHPTREAIDGYWWDCVSGVWQNTGELVDQPLHAYGIQGELKDGGTITIEEGNGYRLEFYVGDSKVTSVTFESSVLPNWCFLDAQQLEIITVLWATPSAPDPDEPGNMFVDPGSYPVTFRSGGKSMSVTVIVTDRVNFP